MTESQAKNAKPREQAYKLADAGGLFLLVQPNGARLWRLKYRYGGKEKLLSFGVYLSMRSQLCSKSYRLTRQRVSGGPQSPATR